MEKIRITLKDNVAETLLIPLWMRAEESKRSDALFHDEISCKLVNSIDYDFSKFDKGICRTTVKFSFGAWIE